MRKRPFFVASKEVGIVLGEKSKKKNLFRYGKRILDDAFGHPFPFSPVSSLSDGRTCRHSCYVIFRDCACSLVRVEGAASLLLISPYGSSSPLGLYSV